MSCNRKATTLAEEAGETADLRRCAMAGLIFRAYRFERCRRWCLAGFVARLLGGVGRVRGRSRYRASDRGRAGWRRTLAFRPGV